MEEGKELWWTLSSARPAIPACLDHLSWELPLLGSLLLPHPPVEKCQWIQSSGISCPCDCSAHLPGICSPVLQPRGHSAGRAGGPALAAAGPRLGRIKNLLAILGPADKNRE